MTLSRRFIAVSAGLGLSAFFGGVVFGAMSIKPLAEERGDFVRISGGTFRMGSDAHYREESRAHKVTVGPFLIKRTEVTNDEFAAFVADTGYVTTAERALDPAENPGVPTDLLKAGSMVFAQPAGEVDLSDYRHWWRYVPGANWKQPAGPDSSIEGRGHHPVVHVSPEDAAAYASWAGGRLPTEAEWEIAARAGHDGDITIDDPATGWKANTWQGAFPATDLAEDGHHGTAPVGSYAANAFGLHDMLGNVWEHVADWWVPGHYGVAQVDPKGPSAATAARYSHPSVGPRRVVKGGSWLCAPSYCMRYRPSARQPAERSIGSNHIGFRIAMDAE